MGFLEIRALTVRFGGLTAVSQVDLSVERGQIFSIIGPNGAGKTTVFNAITGLYQPTEGEVLFRGRSLRDPFRLGVALAAAAIGLCTAVLLALLSANVDAAWRTAIVLNYTDRGERFPIAKAWRDLRGFLWANVAAECEWNRNVRMEVKKVRGKYVVREEFRKVPLEEYDDKEVAQRRAKALYAMTVLAGSARTTVPGDGRWFLVTSANEYISFHDREDEARRQAQLLHDLQDSELVEEGGLFHLRHRGRTLATRPNAFELEDYKLEMEYAAEAAVESGRGTWLVFSEDRKTLLGVFDSREKAKARLVEVAIQSGKFLYTLKVRASKELLGKTYDPEEAEREAQKLEELLRLGEHAPLEERAGVEPDALRHEPGSSRPRRHRLFTLR